MSSEPVAVAESAPRGAAGIARQLGPGLIITAVIVGSGELIVTPKLGASVGFRMLWFIVLGCLLKVFVQVELGRHAVVHGRTTLAALDTLPGPRLRVSWILWLWLLMYLGLVFQVAGMVGGVASILDLAGLPLSPGATAVLVGASCAVLLVVGHYRLVEAVSTALVAAFTVTTMVAVAALQTTPYAVTAGQLLDGLRFRLPPSFNVAFAAFGVIGVGASELIYYPYWCLEKGYAHRVGRGDGSAAWLARARGWLRVMKIDASLSFVLYTSATLAFYVLGAAVLHGKGLAVEDARMIETLSHMYRETFGPWSLWVFLVGAFAVLYSTVFGATASNARLFADAVELFGLVRYAGGRPGWMVRVGSVALPVAFTSVYLAFGNPVSLVIVGAVGQGLMLPFLAEGGPLLPPVRDGPGPRRQPRVRRCSCCRPSRSPRPASTRSSSR
ncbi:MAG: Nramp family divalent metal transporter [Vicinamibacteria bacterium]